MALITSFSEAAVSFPNAPLVISLPATPGVVHNLRYLTVSYSNGGIGDVYVEINGFEVFRASVGNGLTVSWNGLFGNANEQLDVFLDAGGPLVVGSLRINGTED